MVDVFEKLDLVREIMKMARAVLMADVDGTISRTAPTPQEAVVSQICHKHLSFLTGKLALVAAISGRPSSQIEEMVRVPDMVYIGNHGLERLAEGRHETSPEVRESARVIRATLDRLGPHLEGEGIIVEDKGITASIHYRLSPKPEFVKEEILQLLKSLPQVGNLRIVGGKMVLNLLPRIKSNKGTAALKLIKDYKLEGAIYLGDDLTDLDAFKAIHEARTSSDFQGLAIGVIGKEMPKELALSADLTVNGVDGVERLLGWMVQNLKSGWQYPQVDA